MIMYKEKLWFVFVFIFLVFSACKSELDKTFDEVNKLTGSERYTEAIEYITKALEKFPNSPLLFSIRGNCYYATGQEEKALNDYTNSICINQKNAVAYNGIALIYEKNSQYELAEINFKKAIEFEENNVDKSINLHNLAKLYASKKEYTKAIISENQAINSSPDGVYYCDLGVYLYNNGQIKEAEEAWLLGLEKKYFSQAQYKHLTYYQLAIAYFNEKKYEKARENIEKALELSPNNNDYVSLFNRIRSN
jgi:tetratricopeptide (TPR) repeat protein